MHITGKWIFCKDNVSSKIWRLLNFADKLPAFKLKIPKDDLELIKLSGKRLGKKYGE